MTVTVRPAKLSDAEAIATINVAAWQAGYRGLIPDVVLDTLEAAQRVQGRRAWLAEDPGEQRHWVACVAATVVGYADTGPARDDDLPRGTAEVYTLYLDPAHWGTGAGRVLFAHAVSDLAGRGFGRVVLWVIDGNARARRFYEAAGWAADGASKDSDIDGHPFCEVRYHLAVR